MTDNNKHTDPIEELFRRKAEEYDIPFHEADWQDMNERLSIMDEQISRRNRWRWMVAASLLVFSLLGYFTYENNVRINQLSELLDSESQAEEPLSSKGEVYTHDSSDAETQLERQTEQQNESTDRSVAEQNGQTGQGISRQNSTAQQRNSEGDDSVPESPNAPITDIYAESNLYVSEPRCTSCGVSKSSVQDHLTARSIEYLPQAPDAASTLADATGPTSLGNGENVSTQLSRVALSFVAGPDLSTVGSFSDFYDPGYKLGVAVEYNLTSRLSISTGLVQSEVRYRARGNEYKPPYGYWTEGIVPAETIGECLLLDIPVNLKYRFLDVKHSHVYVGVGISSYIMQSEDYQFDYEEDRTDLVQGWYGETGSRHWFSNAGFSVVYELDIHPNWSLRAEPFISVPLKEVGWGNVKLYSLGSFISINYKL